MESIALIRLALEVISDRLITILALIMCCALTSYTLWAGEWTRVATLSIFVVFSYLIVSNKEKSNAKQQPQYQPVQPE
jgi:positive regulator of sigma E activity